MVVLQLGLNIMVWMVRGQASCLFGSVNELLMHLANYTLSWNNFLNYICFWRVHVNSWALTGASCKPGTISEFSEARHNQIWRALRVYLKENWRKNLSEKIASAFSAVLLLAVSLEIHAVGALWLVPFHSVNHLKKLHYLGRWLT